MNGIEHSIIFYPLACVIILFAGLTIFCKNIFYSLLSAIVVFIGVGLLFYVLGSEYNAIIQIAIYGIAVPIILGLAVMFTDSKTKQKPVVSGRMKSIMFLTCGIFILAFIYMTMTSIVINPAGFNIDEPSLMNSIEVIQAFSNGIYIKYVLSFELMSLILTIVVAGLTILNKEVRK